MEGLRPLFDEIIAAQMTVKPDGTYSGHLADVPPTGETRAQILADYCAAEGLKLEQSIAYADSTSDLPMLEAVGFPVAVNPETQTRRDRPKARLAGRALVESRGRSAAAAADRTAAQRARTRAEVRMSRLIFERKPVKFAAARLAGTLAPGRGAAVGPLRLESNEPLPLPGPDWVRLTPRLSGICGSDLAMIDGTASAYFDPLVSYPFVPGHEVVATTERGRRVALVPVLSCVTRGISPVCAQCAARRTNLCERVAFGHLEAGLQSGFCTDTGGGWSTWMVAHTSQLVDIPDDLTDEAAVMIEPTACAAHAALRYQGHETVIIGAGTVGLLTLAAIAATRDKDRSGPLIVTARYAEQRRLAKELGADIVCEPDELPRWVRSATKSMMIGDQLTSGFRHVVDCVGIERLAERSASCRRPRW